MHYVDFSFQFFHHTLSLIICTILVSGLLLVVFPVLLVQLTKAHGSKHSVLVRFYCATRTLINVYSIV